ncbi:hypothetical protein [Sorangium sp. So ce1000]|uniref:hypothetical protein n=1 Tax=Sorangium sp. So ce1000 TaxID=3133325 RepID=UPI003F61EE55
MGERRALAVRRDLLDHEPPRVVAAERRRARGIDVQGDVPPRVALEPVRAAHCIDDLDRQVVRVALDRRDLPERVRVPDDAAARTALEHLGPAALVAPRGHPAVLAVGRRHHRAADHPLVERAVLVAVEALRLAEVDDLGKADVPGVDLAVVDPLPPRLLIVEVLRQPSGQARVHLARSFPPRLDAAALAVVNEAPRQPFAVGVLDEQVALVISVSPCVAVRVGRGHGVAAVVARERAEREPLAAFLVELHLDRRHPLLARGPVAES